MSLFLGTGEIAELCGVSRETVRRWIDLGDLKVSRLPKQGTQRRGHVRVSAAEARRFLEAGGFEVPANVLAATTPTTTTTTTPADAELAKGAA